MSFVRETKSARRRNAFTLVEVVLAVGVVAFALIAILGLISVSLQSSANASHDTEIALASQYVLSALTTQPYSTLTSNSFKTNFYFDFQGAPTTEGNSAAPIVFTCMAQTVPNKAPSSLSWAVNNNNLIAVQLTFTWPGQTITTGNNAKTIWTSISAY